MPFMYYGNTYYFIYKPSLFLYSSSPKCRLQTRAQVTLEFPNPSRLIHSHNLFGSFGNENNTKFSDPELFFRAPQAMHVYTIVLLTVMPQTGQKHTRIQRKRKQFFNVGRFLFIKYTPIHFVLLLFFTICFDFDMSNMKSVRIFENGSTAKQNYLAAKSTSKFKRFI